MLRKNRKILTGFFLCLLVYIAAGALFPFIRTKQVSQEFKDSFQISSFYGNEGKSVDRAAIVETSMDALSSRIQMIHQAKERIVLSTFDIRPGESCDDIFSSVLEAADRGVQVQILVDGLYGSLHMKGEACFYALGSHPNVEIRFYNIPSLAAPWTINGRMHDKYIIIDDKLLLMGGRNTFDYFLGEYNLERLSYDRDVLVYNTASGISRSSDSVIHQADAYFQAMWDKPYCKTVFDSIPLFFHDSANAAREEYRAHYIQMAKQMPELIVSDFDYTPVTVSIKKATWISNPTHIYAKEPWVFYQLQELMANAKERNYIHTPYAVFSSDMYQAMSEICTQVPDTTMLLNSTAVGDNFMASSDYTLNRKHILKTGLKLYEYQGDHSSHGKSVLIDHDLSVIGSYNLDMRSTYVDTEVMLVIHGEEFNNMLEANILSMQASSVKVTLDETYENPSNVEIKPLTSSKKRLFSITSRLFQLIRYLI